MASGGTRNFFVPNSNGWVSCAPGLRGELDAGDAEGVGLDPSTRGVDPVQAANRTSASARSRPGQRRAVLERDATSAGERVVDVNLPS
jgi:hypothetical protein